VTRINSSSFRLRARASRLDVCSSANTITNVAIVATVATSVWCNPNHHPTASHTATADTATGKAHSWPSASATRSVNRLIGGRSCRTEE